jgi:hypothetical protein
VLLGMSSSKGLRGEYHQHHPPRHVTHVNSGDGGGGGKGRSRSQSGSAVVQHCQQCLQVINQ